MLTAQQNRVLQVIRSRIETDGHAPTLEEIGLAVGVRSRGSVHRLVQALIDKGYLERASAGWRGLQPVEKSDKLSLPLLGRIAAGLPIEAIPGEEELNLSDFLLGPNRYALRVQGDSMIDAGILDGDTVVVAHASTARDGEIVVALIDDQHATLKRLQRRAEGQIALVAENPTIPTQIYAADRVTIQGVVVAQLRSYR